jgi:hypothetical protein
MYSRRFGKNVIVTSHARERMAQRAIDEAALAEVIETGEMKRVDEAHVFLFKPLANRRDNLVCVAAVEEANLVVKTVMVNWRLRSEP